MQCLPLFLVLAVAAAAANDRLRVEIDRYENDTRLLLFSIEPIVDEGLYYTNRVTFFLQMFWMDYERRVSEGPLVSFEGDEGDDDVRIRFPGSNGTLHVSHRIDEDLNRTAFSIRHVHDIQFPDGLSLDFFWEGDGNLLASLVSVYYDGGPDDPYFSLDWLDWQQQYWTGGASVSYLTEAYGHDFPLGPYGTANVTLQPVMDCAYRGYDPCGNREWVWVCNKTDAEYLEMNPLEDWPCGDYDWSSPSPSISSRDDGSIVWFFVSVVVLIIVCVVIFGMWKHYRRGRRVGDDL